MKNSFVRFRPLGFRRKTSFAALAGAAFLLATSVTNAATVWSGTVNLTIPATLAGLYINVVTGVSSTTPAGAPGWDINPFSGTGFGLFNPSNPTGGVYVLSAPLVAANLAANTPVDGSSTFGFGAPASFTQWNLNSSDNLFGFRFQNESNSNLIHYGWARMAFGSTIFSRTLVEYAYESVAGVGINAGNIRDVGTVPEPGTLALLGLGLTGLALSRRRKKAA